MFNKCYIEAQLENWFCQGGKRPILKVWRDQPKNKMIIVGWYWIHLFRLSNSILDVS